MPYSLTTLSTSTLAVLRTLSASPATKRPLPSLALASGVVIAGHRRRALFDWYGVGNTGAFVGRGPDQHGPYPMEDGHDVEMLDIAHSH